MDTTPMEKKVLEALLFHIGQDKKIDMWELFDEVFERPVNHRINDTRSLRKLVTSLRKKGAPICSTSNDKEPGYWLDLEGTELRDYCQRLERRALRALSQAAVLRRVPLPELLGQLALEI